MKFELSIAALAQILSAATWQGVAANFSKTMTIQLPNFLRQ
jgi:hypothetical protein